MYMTVQEYIGGEGNGSLKSSPTGEEKIEKLSILLGGGKGTGKGTEEKGEEESENKSLG